MKQYQADFGSLNRKQRGLLFYVICVRYTKFWPENGCNSVVCSVLLQKLMSLHPFNWSFFPFFSGSLKKTLVIVGPSTVAFIVLALLLIYGSRYLHFKWKGRRRIKQYQEEQRGKEFEEKCENSFDHFMLVQNNPLTTPPCTNHGFIV